MSYVLAQVALQRTIQIGLKYIKTHPEILDEIFAQYLYPEMESDYGQQYIDKLKNWFLTTKIPVLQIWSLNPDRIPAITVGLATEAEDESKAAINDYLGAGEFGEIGVNVSNVTLDIGIHTSKTGDEVIWMYYITSHVLFRFKRLAEKLGLQLNTFSANEYSREPVKLGDQIWSRWIKYKCTVTNTWDGTPYLDIDDMEIGIQFESANIEGE